jgi:hypothetical protein
MDRLQPSKMGRQESDWYKGRSISLQARTTDSPLPDGGEGMVYTTPRSSRGIHP